MKITVGGKEYTLEFTFEASLYDECTEKIMTLLLNIEKAGNEEGDIRKYVSSISSVPQTTLTMFYAGLLEHHGSAGDNTIRSKEDAKNLLRQYFGEDKSRNFYTMLAVLTDTMREDGFFERMGVTEGALATMGQAMNPKRGRKALPQKDGAK